MSKLSHINQDGNAQMVDVSDKKITNRQASACASISLKKETITLIKSGDNNKGDVLATARIAGIQAAKKCSELIPLCHQLMLSKVSVDITIDEDNLQINIIATAKLSGKTGVEMEALVAASVAALTIYDMCKAVDRFMVINDVHILSKTGGKSGAWNYNND